MTLREPQRLLLFALTVLIHLGLLALLVSERRIPLDSHAERSSTLLLLPDRAKTKRRVEIVPAAPERLPQPLLPEIAVPQLIAPSANQDISRPPAIDWRYEAQEAARKLAIEAPAPDEQAPRKAKPEFAWTRSSTHPIEPMEGGGFVVWINDNCGVAIGMMAMPFCKLGRKPARGDLFEHMNEPATHEKPE